MLFKTKKKGIPGILLNVIQGAYSDTFADIYGGDLIKSYIKGYHEGKITVPFSVYLKGVIRNKVHENYEKISLIHRRRLSEKELLDKIADSKKIKTKREYIGLAKARYGDIVRDYLLGDYPEPIGHVVDYFFERFIEAKYPSIRKDLKRGEAIFQLLKAFSKTDYDQGKNYIGSIPPRPEQQEIPLPKHIGEEELSEEESLDLLSQGILSKEEDVHLEPEQARARRVAYWDQMIQGLQPNPSEIQQTLGSVMKDIQNPEERRGYALCLACANLLQTGSDVTRRDLRIFLIHHFSQCGDVQKAHKIHDPARITLEDIEGRHLTWKEASRLVGKNPDYSAHTRIKGKIEREFEKVWRDLYGDDDAVSSYAREG